MAFLEPHATAVLLVTLGLLMLVSAVFSRVSGRFGVPVALTFLVLGMVAGEEGLGRIVFEDYGTTFRIGTVALVVILFGGGFSTPLHAVQRALAPAALLATLGVLATAALLAACAHWLGMSWPSALLLGAIVASTDASAVFSVLRGSGVHLRERLAMTLELESGLNDPMAILLTTALTSSMAKNQPMVWSTLLADVALQLLAGFGMGLAIGVGGSWLLARVRLSASGLYPVVTFALAFLAFGAPTLFRGSGFLAVYVTGLVLGNAPLPYRTGLMHVHDAAGWLSQIVMFLLLGLLVFPSRLISIAPIGLTLALFLAFVARPVAVAVCLLPFRFGVRETAFVSWVGLRGAVPIILATVPVLAGLEQGRKLFDIVFFVVVINAIIPGGTVAKLARALSLEQAAPPPPPAVLEITSTQKLHGEVLSFYVDQHCPVLDVPLASLSFPEGAAVMLIVRGHELVAPKGGTVLTQGDHVFVFCRPEQVQRMQHMLSKRSSRRSQPPSARA